MRILLVDDNPGRAAILVEGMRRAGHQVGHATAPALAAVLAQSLRPDVVFATLGSREALRPLVTARCLAGAQLVGLIDQHTPRAEDQAAEAGLDRLVELPLDPSELVARLLSQTAPRG